MNLQRIKTDLLALALLAATLFIGLSLVSYDPGDPPSTLVYPVRAQTTNLCGPKGAHLAHALRTGIGLGAYFGLFSLVTANLRLFRSAPVRDPFVRLLGIVLSLLSVCVLLQLAAPGLGEGPVIGSGGIVGIVGLALLEHDFSTVGTVLLCTAVLTAGLILSGQIVFIRFALRVLTAPLRFLWRYLLGLPAAGDTLFDQPEFSEKQEGDDEVADWDERRRHVHSKHGDETDEDASLEDDDSTADALSPDKDLTADDHDDGTDEDNAERKPIKVNPPVTINARRAALRARLDAKTNSADENADYAFPDVDLLDEPEEFPYDLLAKKAQVAAMTLEKTFREFGLNVRVAEIDTGPVITQYELELEAGLRLNKVTALADDLAIALRVPSVRVVAPIPGKNTVGVEVPNEKQVMVRLRELIESCPEDVEKCRIPLFLGKDVSGHPLSVDLSKLPHLLIAGRTGTGKSVCLNALILSILMSRSPDEVKMLMIDPKMVELSPYKRVPHLMHPVITDMKKAEAVLAWAVDKMEERYDLLARCGVRHLDGYNKLGKEKVLKRLGIDPDDPEQAEEAASIPERMPYIVIIADEMADMMMTSGKDVEGHIIRLAQKSRAVGIHLVLATQKPTVDVITGLIKSNLPSRISFQVASRTDSRVVLDELGAERLLGNGDMLYLAPGTSNLTRAQGTYVDDEEINRIIEFFGVYEPQYSTELAQVTTSSGSGGSSSGDGARIEDDLYDDAIEVVIREGRGSVSLLQRALGIGYGRAARLIDYMAEDGIVGEYNGSQAREVLYTAEQWEALKEGAELEPAGV